MIQNEHGFSLIELMIVVAIIGVLSTVAVPNYNLMAAKSQQAEAKTALASIFASEVSFHADQNQYTYCLYQAGYIPEGSRIRFTTGFYGVSGCTTCWIDYSTGKTCSLALLPWSLSIRNDATFFANTYVNPALAYGGIAQDFQVEPDSFTAVAFGSLSPAAIYDIWTIDQNNRITNLQPGI